MTDRIKKYLSTVQGLKEKLDFKYLEKIEQPDLPLDGFDGKWVKVTVGDWEEGCLDGSLVRIGTKTIMSVIDNKDLSENAPEWVL